MVRVICVRELFKFFHTQRARAGNLAAPIDSVDKSTSAPIQETRYFALLYSVQYHLLDGSLRTGSKANSLVRQSSDDIRPSFPLSTAH